MSMHRPIVRKGKAMQGTRTPVRSSVALGLAVALGMSLLAAAAEAAPTLAPGVNSAATLKGTVRFRNFGGIDDVLSGGEREVQLGLPDEFGGVTGAAEGDIIWASPGVFMSFSSGNPFEGLSLSLDGGLGNSVTGLSKDIAALRPLNYIEITIKKNTPGTSLSLQQMQFLSPNPDGSGPITNQVGSVSVSGNPDTRRWNVTGADLAGAFALTGFIVYSAGGGGTGGASGGPDDDYIQIDVGYVPPSVECEGFDVPFDVAIGLNKKTQRIIPLRMSLYDADGGTLGPADIAPPVVSVRYTSGIGSEDLSELVESAGKATTGNAFVWDASTARWTYNLATKPYTSTGTYTVSAVAGDASYTIAPTCEGTFVRQ